MYMQFYMKLIAIKDIYTKRNDKKHYSTNIINPSSTTVCLHLLSSCSTVLFATFKSLNALNRISR